MFSVLNNRQQIYNKNIMEYCRKSREEYIKRIVKRKKNNSKNNVTFIEKEIKKTPPLDIINHSLYKNITSFINTYIFSFIFRHKYI